MSEVTHAAAIAIAKIQAEGKIPQPTAALLARIEELEAGDEELNLELAHLRHVAELASDAVEYHKLGYRSDRDQEIEPWSAAEMLARMESLAEAMQ